jgi:hypothetical protein
MRTDFLLEGLMGDNIKTDLREIGCYVVDWIVDKWRALMNTVMNLRFP